MHNNIRAKESAIIVLHEIYGINTHIKWVCEHYEQSQRRALKLADKFLSWGRKTNSNL